MSKGKLNNDYNRILLLGYPIDRVEVNSLEGVIADLVSRYSEEKRPRFATTVNGLVIGQLSTCNLNQRINPEVVDSFRQADFVGLDSEGLQLLAKLLGNSLDNLIRGENVLFAAASYLVKEGGSLFLLGGPDPVCQSVAEALKQDFPRLKIAGTVCPGIYTKGERLEESLEKDPIIVDAINQAKPTILALQLGHPKQEIWFERIKKDLKVPLCIGVAGAYERYLTQRRSSEHLERGKLEWHKIRRRIVSGLHYACWVPPLFLFNTLNRMLSDIRNKISAPKILNRQLFLSEKESLAVVPFPPFIDRAVQSQMQKWIDESLEHENVLLDFSSVRHLDLAGLGLLHEICSKVVRPYANLFILGLKPDVRWLLKLHGAWDIIEPYVCLDTDDVLDRMSINQNASLKHEREFVSIRHEDHQTYLSFFGRLQGSHALQNSWRQLGSILDGHSCIVDLNYCSSITNRGFGFLLEFRELVHRQRQLLIIKCASRNLKRQFAYSKLKDMFKFEG